jgi:hypothetical protein
MLLVLSISVAFCADDEEGYSSYVDAYADGYEAGFSDGKNRSEERFPDIVFILSDELQEVDPGDTLEMKIEFKNKSRFTAKDLKITPQLEDHKVLIYERPLSYTNLTFKENQKASYTFRIKVSDDAKIGTYPLKFKIEYKNSYSQAFSREESVYFKVVSEKTKPILNISNIRYSKNKLKAGDIFTAYFDINNIGGSEAYETEVKIDGFDDSKIMPIDSRDYVYVGTIERKTREDKSQVTSSFDLLISDSIETPNNTLTVTVTYKDYDGNDHTATKKLYITNIEIPEKDSGDKKEEEKKDEKPIYAKPKVIVSSYNYSKNTIVAGDTFAFNFTFRNTSKDTNIRNIKITINSSEGAFIITNGSNTFYVESMGKSSSVSKSLCLKAKQDLLSNSYPVNVDFDYEDYEGVEYTSRETLNIPVTEFSKLVINSAYVSEGYVDTPTSLSFEYVNMGKATVSNLIATVTGDLVPVQETTYIGNLQAGSSDYYDIEVKPTKEGKNIGTLILSFEDSSGRTIDVKRDIEATAIAEKVYNEDPLEGLDIDTPAQKDEVQFETWQIILAGLGALLVTFILVRTITKKVFLKKFEDEI